MAEDEAALGATFDEPEPSTHGMAAPSTEAIEAAREAQGAAQDRLAQAVQIRQTFAQLEEQVARGESQREILPTVPCGGKGKYATCRFLTDVPAAAELEEARSSLERTRVVLVDPAELRADVERTSNAFNDLIREVNDANRATDKAEAEHRLWAARRESFNATQAARARAAQQVQDRVLRATEEQAAATAALEAVGKELADPVRLEADLVTQESTRAGAQERIDAAEPKLRELEGRLAVIADAERQLADERTKETKAGRIAEMFGWLAEAWHRDGLPTAHIEAAVPAIEERANEILSRLPEDLAVQLRTQRPTKGGMAETLDIIVTIDGWESEYGLLSVGARFRVDLALRLALADLLTHRTGASIQTLWLDEPLAALDAPSVEATVETLTALSDDFGLIVVVSHHPTFNDAFEAAIAVRKEDGVATAQLQEAA
jgi:DNA repair exonuclease SbcCD ATPase subunit